MDNIALVATDLDGTLFYDRENIAPPDRAMLTKLHEAGIMIALATGRDLGGVLPALDALDLWDIPRYIIHSGGSGLFDVHTRKDEILGCLTPDILHDVYDRYQDCTLSILIVCGRTIYTNRVTDGLREEGALLRYTVEQVDDFHSVLEAPNCKLMLHGDFDALDEILPLVTADPDPRYRFYRSHDHYIDCTAAGVDKGTALAELCRRTGIPIADTLGIGDNLNDTELLLTAGHSACPGDGHPAVFQYADYVACAAKDGAFADACNHFVFP